MKEDGGGQVRDWLSPKKGWESQKGGQSGVAEEEDWLYRLEMGMENREDVKCRQIRPGRC